MTTMTLPIPTTAECARQRALEFAADPSYGIIDPEAFADDYVAMIEDRMYELRYPTYRFPPPSRFGSHDLGIHKRAGRPHHDDVHERHAAYRPV